MVHRMEATDGATPTAEEFRSRLNGLLREAELAGEPYLDVGAGDLHRLVGAYPGPKHRMPTCCQVMRTMMQSGDLVLKAPPSGAGAALTIRYRFPRKAGG